MNRVAAIQMASGPKVPVNLEEAERLINQAVQGGAELVVLPENFALMGMTEQDKVEVAEEDGSGPMQDFLARMASTHGIWLVGGTVPIRSPEPGKVYGACLLYNDQGERVARYDKIHLFDVHLEDTGESYNESETILNGDRIVVAETPFGRLGLAVCYDLRFPELFRGMLEQGVELVALPSAFTALTGKAHWECLIRARAIENLIYMIAPGQGGYHVNGRETHGHSMVVDPWGNILNQLKSGSGVVPAEIDLERLRHIRKNFPALEHRRLDCRIIRGANHE
ncbi:MAG: carbon-nitrogen hydrolase family protein [Gammaproteobacteria bacterium]|nr:MAG: carbon-nitrogen hydrolase family protein [Gammaproteobacteria bacterium]